MQDMKPLFWIIFAYPSGINEVTFSDLGSVHTVRLRLRTRWRLMRTSFGLLKTRRVYMKYDDFWWVGQEFHQAGCIRFRRCSNPYLKKVWHRLMRAIN